MKSILTDLIQLAQQYDQVLPPYPDDVSSITRFPILSLIDQTLLKPEATPSQVEQLCLEARDYPFASVCINPVYVPLAARLLNGTTVKVCSVVGFPLGASLSKTKVSETQQLIEAGASEIDMVMAVGLLKGQDYQAVIEDIQGVAETCHAHGILLKVILENCLLTRQEKITACLLCQAAGADFVKTSTGFNSGGATIEDIELMRRVVGSHTKTGVKAAGGVRTLADARAMINAGANRIGSSAGAKIAREIMAETA
jgi:deoxyribose-phosphate aldolase